MRRLDKIYALDLIIYNHKRKQYDYYFIQKLIEQDYADWFSWYDRKLGRFKHKINATQKGMLYYTGNKGSKRKKFAILICVALLILPVILTLM